MTADQAKDAMWAEIRQLVLNEGPVPEKVDEAFAEHEADPETREAFIAQMIGMHCARITQISKGPYQGAPLSIIMCEWAKELVSEDAETVALIMFTGESN